MLRRIPRFLRRAVLVAVVLAVSASVYQSWASGSPGTDGWTQTQWGPIGPADRNFLQKVRLAGLWEGPTGQQAQQRAISPAVQEIGRKLGIEHADLDRQVRDVANKLGVDLPSAPNAIQMGWIRDISSRTGADYDRVFIQTVRFAHGQILPVISDVRVGTRNTLIRDFALVATAFVSRHCAYLESSGLVNYAALPTPASPGLLSGSTDPKDLVAPILVFVAVVLAAIGLFSALRSKTTSRPARITVPQPSSVAAVAPVPALTAVAAIPGPRGSPPELDVATEVVDHYRAASNSATYYAASESGTYRAATESTAFQPVAEQGYRPVYETDTFQPVAESDTFRSVTDSGGYRAVTDSGRYRAVTDSGSHRAGSKPRSRHSSRR